MAETEKQRPGVKKNNVVLNRLVVEYVAIDAIKPNDYNPNRQSEHDFEMLLRSIEDDGFTQPVVVHRPSMTIVDGEHRWRACKALGFKEVPVVLTDMSLEQMRIATLRHNRARGSEDAGLAAEVLKELISLGTMEWAQDALMLDDVEVRRLTETMRADDINSLVSDAQVDDSMLGPSGHGLTEGDQAGDVNLEADRLRAKERILAAQRTAEEDTMSATDHQNYRLVLYFVGEEAEVISRVLGKDPPTKALELCRARAGA